MASGSGALLLPSEIGRSRRERFAEYGRRADVCMPPHALRISTVRAHRGPSDKRLPLSDLALLLSRGTQKNVAKRHVVD